MSKRILFVGPETNVDKGLVGGATISFGHLTDFFRRKNSEMKVINTKRFFGRFSSMRNMLYTFRRVTWNLPRAQVIFLNSSRGGTNLLSPLLYIMAKLTGAKFVFRPFGGDMKDYTQSYGLISRWLFKNTTLKADILYLQTEELLQFYGVGKQLRTSRQKPKEHFSGPQNYRKRFIFIGFIVEDKGIEEILMAKKMLPESYIIHLYGPIKSEKYRNLPVDIHKGVLEAQQVLPVLSKYDVLILPTYYGGEGYPGVIIEAYSLGLPVITTRWKAIPEIVEDRKTGLLITPKSTDELVAAIRSIGQENYKSMSQNALQYFNDTFDEEIVLGKVRQEIESL